MLWVGQAFQSLRRPSGGPSDLLPTANTLAWSGPNQRPCHKLNFELITGRLPIGAWNCRAHSAPVGWQKSIPKSVAGQIWPRGLSHQPRVRILPERRRNTFRSTAICHWTLSFARGVQNAGLGAGEKSAAEFGEGWPAGNNKKVPRAAVAHL